MFKLLKRLFGRSSDDNLSSNRIVNETRLISSDENSIQEIKFDENETDLLVSMYLKFLIKNKQIKEYKNLLEFINVTIGNDIHVFEVDKLDYKKLNPSNRLKLLSRKAKLLQYKCGDKKFIEWLTNIK